MPIFHFDIADGVRLEDPVGLDCKSEHDARKTADLIARQIAIDLDDDREGRCVVVIDEAARKSTRRRSRIRSEMTARFLCDRGRGAGR